MITLNGNPYRLCLLDTNAVSEMAKRPQREFRDFITWALDREDVVFIPCLTLFTVLELRKRPDVYRGFLDLFDRLPCAVLQGHEQLLQAEIAAYPNPAEVSPMLLGFGGAAAAPGAATLAAVLDAYFATGEGQQQERGWVRGAPSIVAGMTSLVDNYPPASASYSPQEIRQFVEWAGFSQIAMRAPGFAHEMLDRGDTVRIDAFPSIKMTAFTVFYKFYVDTQRRPSDSDAFDVIIAAPLPYVDAVLTERHQAEVIRKTRQQDLFLEQLQVLTLRDFRDGTPPR